MGETFLFLFCIACAISTMGVSMLIAVVWLTARDEVMDWWCIRKMRKSLKELYDEDYPRAFRLLDRPPDDG